MRLRPKHLLAFYYFTFFAAAGIYAPYLGLYTRGLGFTSLQIGLLASLTPLSKILFPPAWGFVADRTGGRKGLIFLTTALSILAFSLLLEAASFLPVALALLVYSFFHAPILALSETLVLEESAREGFAYGRVRAWGSLGYLLAALFLGKILDLTSMRTFVIAFVAVSALQLMASVGLPSVTVPRASHAARGVADQLLRPEVLVFLALCTLMEMSHSGYNGFFAIHLSELGYSKSAIGPLLALPVLSEILALLVADQWLARWGTRTMFGVSLSAAVIRWLLLAAFSGVVPVAASQVLHSLTYGVFHVTAIHRARALFPSHLQASAQSLYIGLTYGLGGAVGLMGAGKLYDMVGSGPLFVISALVALAALPLLTRMGDLQPRDMGQARA
jgi:PPP family 3-phenylpropionic acid transporter